MCSKSNVNEALKGVTGSGSGAMVSSSSVIPSIAAHRVRQNREAYFLVDIREAAEIQETPFPDANASVPMGALCNDATDLLAQVSDNKTIVVVCNTGLRAELTAQSLVTQSPTAQVAVLQRGLVGWASMAALSPDFLVVLGLGDSPEKLSLALAAVAGASEIHSTVVLALMSDGVNWFLKPDSPKKTTAVVDNVENVSVAAFKPCKAMLNKFLTNGGVVLACTTCIKHREYSFETDMMDCVNALQMPDLIRMLGEAKGGSLQFM